MEERERGRMAESWEGREDGVIEGRGVLGRCRMRDGRGRECRIEREREWEKEY